MPDQILTSWEEAIAHLHAQSNPPHRILVVDDDSSVRQLNTKVLQRAGYAVDAAADGDAAWEALGAEDYDLMITDNAMPKLTGVELLKKLRSTRATLPVIMATGTPPEADFLQQSWLRPDAILVKPHTVEELLRTVKRVLREANPSPAVPGPELTNGVHRILVVDEDRDLRRLYAEALAGPGYEVSFAEDGAAGWEALQASRFNLLITEHDLPRLTGVELIRNARAAHMDLPIVMAAGRLPIHELAQHPSLQLAATLMKPFAVEALLDTVRNALQATDRPYEPLAPPPNGRDRPTANGWQL